MKRFSNECSSQVSIAAENINRLDSRQSDIFESRIAFLRELTDMAMKSVDGDQIYDKLRKAYFVSAPQKASTSDFDANCKPYTLKSFFDSVSVIEKLEICRELVKAYGSIIDHEQLLRYTYGSVQHEAAVPNSLGRIAYMKNNYTESAFMEFSKIIQNPRSAYFQSFDDVCEEVYSGGCEFCILPIENSSEGRLNSFYSMIDRYELKIAAVCVVEQHDSQRSTKFALLKKSFSVSVPKHSHSGDMILEFKISFAAGESGASLGTEASPVCDIILAANASGMRLIRIDTIPLPYNDEMMAYYISLIVDSSQLLTFLLYMILEFPQCEPLGVYYAVN